MSIDVGGFVILTHEKVSSVFSTLILRFTHACKVYG
jgi:hypothetical protein